MIFALLIACIILLVLLISALKFHPFIAFIIVSIFGGMLFGIPIENIPSAIQKGIGDTVGSILMVLLFGAMSGKLIAESGAAQQISSVLLRISGTKYISWALMLTGFVLGIPLYYNVGFVLLMPLVFTIMYRVNMPAVYLGIPMCAALSTNHGLLPPHPSPAALVVQFQADMGMTLLYGFFIAIPTVIVAGPVLAEFLKKIPSNPIQTFKPREIPENELPGFGNSLFTCLLPVILLAASSLLGMVPNMPEGLKKGLVFVSDPGMLLLISLLYGTFSLGVFRKMKMGDIMAVYGDSVKDILFILLIVGGAGALKQVLIESGVSQSLAEIVQPMNLPPLILGWFVAGVIRIAMGSATVAGLTTAGIMAPMIPVLGADPNLMVLAVGSGSLLFSHVNDSGFWLFKEYFNLSIKDTIKSWSLMETVVSVMGLIGTLIVSAIIS